MADPNFDSGGDAPVPYFNPPPLDPAVVLRDLAAAYPAVTRSLPEFQKVHLVAPSVELPPFANGQYTPPGESMFPGGSIHLYANEPSVALHEFGHAMSVPVMGSGDWDRFMEATRQYAQSGDPNWRLKNELLAGYASTNPYEAYAEIPRLTGGNVSNIPEYLRDYYNWLGSDSVSGGRGLFIPPNNRDPQPYNVNPLNVSEAERNFLSLIKTSPQQADYIEHQASPKYVSPDYTDPRFWMLWRDSLENAFWNAPTRMVDAYGGVPAYLRAQMRSYYLPVENRLR